jgi:hypothetical protein
MEVLIAHASAWNTVVFWLEYCGILLEYCGILLEYCGVLLEYCGVLLEYCGVLLEYCGILPKVEADLLPWTMFILTCTTTFT